MSFLSVVLATYNREETMRTTLRLLGQQTLPKNKYEVIVIDDGSKDNTVDMVREFINTADYDIRLLHHENRGPGYTQNRGIREARGPWVLLMADDIHAFPGMLEAHYRMHEQHPDPNIAVAGKVTQSPHMPQTVFLKNWNPFRYDQLEQLEELSYINFWACNISVKRQFMLDHGMFLERRAAAHEDVELGWRLYKSGGLRVLYSKEAAAYHYHEENLDAACRRAYQRGKHADVLFEMINDPGLYLRYHILGWDTLKYILNAHNVSHANILREDRNVVWFVIREAIRRPIFNRLTVPYIFIPLIKKAETSRLAEALICRIMLRGVVSYHFLRGLRDLRKERAVAGKPLRPVV